MQINLRKIKKTLQQWVDIIDTDVSFESDRVTLFIIIDNVKNLDLAKKYILGIEINYLDIILLDNEK